MRLLHVIQPPWGGATTLVELLTRLQVDRHEVGVVCHPSGPLAARARAVGAEVWTRAADRRVRPQDDVRHLVELRRLVRRFEPDIIHAHSSKAGVLGRLVGRAQRIPVVFSPHNFAYRAYEGSRGVRALFFGVERALAPLTSFLHVSCDDELEDALRHRMARPERCAVVYNGIDLEPFRAAPPPPRERLTIGTYGRLWPQKRIDLLVEAAARLARAGTSFELRVIGEGPSRDGLERLAQRLGIARRVSFEGRPASPREALAKMDVFVLPSVNETYPLTVMEAMALGRTVVATRVGGLPEMIEHGQDGLLVPPRDVLALESALSAVIEDAALRAELSSAARHKALSRFDVRHMADGLDAVYVAADARGWA